MILFVEDEPHIRKMMTTALSLAGYDIVAAGSGTEALRLFEANAGRLGLVILDLRLPDASGLELLEIFRAKKADLKVLIASGYSREMEEASALAGPDAADWISKPYTPGAMIQRVKGALGY